MFLVTNSWNLKTLIKVGRTLLNSFILLIYTAIVKRKVYGPLDYFIAVKGINTGSVDSILRSVS